MNIYTDGACKENLRDNGVGCGVGGWAYVILDQEEGRDMEIVISDSGFKDGTTNQEMEIIAVAEAFEHLSVVA
jgi:Ribonuclease HI